MARYTQEDIDAAVQEGLITPEDGAYLAEALQPGLPIGAGIGAALGGVAGFAAGGAGGKKLAQKFMGRPIKGTAQTVQEAGAQLANRMNKASYIDAGVEGLGTGVGLGAGAMAGNAIAPPEDNAENFAEINRLLAPDRDAALRALIDPNTPPEVKRQLLAQLQAEQGGVQNVGQQEPPQQAGFGGQQAPPM